MSIVEIHGGGDRRSMIKRYERKSKHDAIRELIDLVHCSWNRIDQLEAMMSGADGDAARLNFMLAGYRKVVVERLPAFGDHDNLEVYVEEGFLGEQRYPAIAFVGDWGADALTQIVTKRRAIDAALAAQQGKEQGAGE